MKLGEYFTLDRNARSGGQPAPVSMLCLRLVLNPGYRAVVYYRIACFLKQIRFPRRTTNLLAALMLVRLSRVPGVEIRPGAVIGQGLHLPHPHDIVVGSGARDLLARDAVKDTGERYPTREDGVTLFTGAKVLGPIRIGRNSLVGANSVVLHSFPENSVLVGAPARNIAGSGNPVPPES